MIRPDGGVASVADIRATFESIVSSTPPPEWGAGATADEMGIGVLTTEERDVWARHRAALIDGDSSGSNRRSLGGIDSAFLVVALDHCDPGRDGGLAARCRSLLHGVVTPHRTLCNRWFDKHQLVVDGAGEMGYLFEHSYSDGASWNKVLAELWEDMHKTPTQPASSTPLIAEPLPFELPESVKAGIIAAEKKARVELYNEVDLQMLDFDAFGKKEVKQWKLSPDAVVQQAFQLAYFRLHGKAAPTYEACAMRPFFHGRTETIRSCTTAAQDFVAAVVTGRPRDEQRAKLSAAVVAQSQLAKAAATGQGIDRHLLGLKMEAKEHGVCAGAADLEIFDDDDYKRSGTWVLSTSNVTMPFINTFGFGAVTGEGYGLGYQIHDDRIPVHITSFASGAGTSSAAFRDATADALCDIRYIAQASSSAGMAGVPGGRKVL